MKKRLSILSTLLAICLFSTQAHAAWFGLDKLLSGIIKPELSLLKQEVHGDVNGVRAEVGKLADVQVKANANLSAKVDSIVAGIAGVNNSVSSIKTGRDNIQTTTTTNDGETIIGIIKSLNNGYTYIIALLMMYIRILSKQRAALESRLMDFIDQQEEAQGKYICLLENIANKALGEKLSKGGNDGQSMAGNQELVGKQETSH